MQGFVLNDTTTYLYTKNLQGDITSIVNESGQTILNYTYDAWGAVSFSATSMQNMLLAYTLSFVSPFTYRSYCYDYDIELYYLQSRYYSAEIGRFINTDDTQIAIATQGEILGANLFAYCENEPVNNCDPTGNFTGALVLGGIVISAGELFAWALLFAFSILYYVSPDFRNAIKQLIQTLIYGIASCASALIGVISNVIKKAKSGRKYNSYHTHHIVAKADRRASFSRALLKYYGIGIDSIFNLVKIKKTLHVHLHTNLYHSSVSSFLLVAAVIPIPIKQKYKIILGLCVIGALLKIASSRV